MNHLPTLLALALCATVSASFDSCDCDVVLVLDASGSISTLDWERTKNFTREIVNGLLAGDNTHSVGIVTFGNTATTVSELSSDKAALLTLIDAMVKTTGTTRTDLGITAGMSVLSSSTSACKNMKVITDGQSNVPADTAAAAQSARDAGYILMSFGVGTYVQQSELDAIASAPVSEYALILDSYSALVTLAGQLYSGCDATPEPSPAPCGCDVMLILDASGSISDHGWVQMKDFARIIIDGLEPEMVSYGIKFGIVTFGNSATLDQPMSSDYDAILVKLESLAKTTGTTRTDLAIDMAIAELDSSTNCGVIKIVTDGQSNVPADTQEAAARARASDYHIVAVGVGDAADDTELMGMASYPPSQNALHLDSFDGLSDLAHVLVTECEAWEGTPVLSYDECHCDMVLVLDASGSITDDDWDKTKAFADYIVDDWDKTKAFADYIVDALQPYFAEDDMRVGIITFGNAAYIQSELSYDYYHLKGVIAAMEKTSGTTRTWLALGEAHNVLEAQTRGLGQCKTVVLVTDGNSNNLTQTATAASVLKSGDYATIHAIGVSSAVGDEELELIADSLDHVQHIDSYDGLLVLADSLVHRCLSPTPTPPIPDVTPEMVIEDDCNCDLVIVLDNSGSIMAADWINMLDFARVLVNDLSSHLGPDPDTNMRISIVTFANSATVEVTMTYDVHALLTGLDNAVKTSGSTRTWLGLELAEEELLNHSPVDKCKLIKVVTDGLSNTPAKTATQAHEIKASGIANIMAIGVGYLANDTELDTMASAPSDQNSIHINDFSGLADLAHNIGDHCINGTTLVPPPVDECTCDIMLVLDSSGSITDSDWDLMKAFATKVVTDLTDTLDPDGMRIGIVTYANTAVLESELTADPAALFDAINGMQKTTGTTRTDRALEMAADELMAKNRGLGYCKAIKLVTDGESNNPAQTASVAHTIKNEDLLTIYAVGVGQANDVEINNVASAPVDEYTLHLDDFSGLEQFADIITEGCQEVEETGDCHCDMMLVLDSSGSIDDAGWVDIKNFATVIIQNLRAVLQNGMSRIGVIQYSGIARVVHNVSSDAMSLLAAVNNDMPRLSGVTMTDLAIDLAEQVLIDSERSQHACKVIKLVTDGASTYPNRTSASALRMHNDDHNIAIMAIGVGDDVEDNELDTIASPPKDVNALHLDSFAGLNDLSHIISDKCLRYNYTSVCNMTELTSCVVAKRPTTPCAQIDAYSSCANQKICPDILKIWCDTYFTVNTAFSSCPSVTAVCEGVNSECNIGLYGECYAQIEMEADCAGDLDCECDKKNRFMGCSNSALCLDLINQNCAAPGGGSTPTCNVTACDILLQTADVDLSLITKFQNIPGVGSKRSSSAAILVGVAALVVVVVVVAVVVVVRRNGRREEESAEGAYEMVMDEEA